MNALQKITERVWRSGDPNDPGTARPMLTLDEFFEGNDVVGSIGCNLDGSPHPREIWRALRKIEETDGVDAVYVVVTVFDVPEWPFSDAVRIVTSHSVDAVRSWFPAKLAPDEVWVEAQQSPDQEPIRIPSGMQIIGVWWD